MDLKSFREDKLNIKTQSAFAELIGVEQSNISRWEKDPNSIPYQVIQKILEVTGATFEELTGWEKPIPKPLEVNNSWSKADFTKRTLADYVTSALENADIPDAQRKAYVDDLRNGLSNKIVKPQVAIVGRSDTGKSTMINALLGADKMPTAWTPTTSIAVYIKHISDKPKFIKDDVDVWVFGNYVGDENLWDVRRLDDEEYCRAWKIGAGRTEILHSYGTRQGDNSDKEAGAAVMFIDAPILNTCDIIDLPGFGTEKESDDNITFKVAQMADVIIYLSQANGFMRLEDITYLKRNIRELPVWEKQGENKLNPLANLFVVASQAHTVNSGNRAQLNEILDVGCSNLLKTLSDGYWANRQSVSGYNYVGYGKNELRSRFFIYTTDILDLSSQFNQALKQVLETLPVIINDRAKAFVHAYVKTRKPNLVNEIQKYEGLLNEHDKYVSLLNEIESNELSRMKDNDKRKNEVRDKIIQLRDSSIEEFSEYMAGVINTDSLIQMMKNKGIKNKKADVELFGSSLQSMLQVKCESILASNAETLSHKTNDYVTEFSESVSHVFGKSNVEVDFDAGWAFTSALSKYGLVGGLGGLGTFLAGYGAFWLGGTAFVIGIGGDIALGAMGFGGLLGPIGIAIGLLLAIGLGVVKLFGGGWEKSVAKKIVAAFDENDVNGTFRTAIREYWSQTDKAFEHASAVLDEEWAAYVKNLRSMIESYNINDIQHKIASLKCLSDFFDNIPL